MYNTDTQYIWAHKNFATQFSTVRTKQTQRTQSNRGKSKTCNPIQSNRTQRHQIYRFQHIKIETWTLKKWIQIERYLWMQYCSIGGVEADKQRRIFGCRCSIGQIKALQNTKKSKQANQKRIQRNRSTTKYKEIHHN